MQFVEIPEIECPRTGNPREILTVELSDTFCLGTGGMGRPDFSTAENSRASHYCRLH